MNYIQKFITWWRVLGKLYLLYTMIVYLVLSPFIKTIPWVAGRLPDEKYGIAMIAACLYLIVQIMMGLFREENKEVSLRKFEDHTEGFKKRLDKARRLDILCSSSETFYPILKNTFSTQKIECRMLLRHPLKGIEKQKRGMQYYYDRYNEIIDGNKECNLTIKYCMNTFSRIIIIDNSEVYFGFYRFENNRLLAKDLEMIHARAGSYFGNFILNIAKNRFESIWESADLEMNEREKLIY
jgi:hypothetical protein